jgi:hypothetical protein
MPTLFGVGVILKEKIWKVWKIQRRPRLSQQRKE